MSPTTTHRSVPSVSPLLLAALTCCCAAAAPKHILLIGIDGFGAYAYEKASIPNIKSLAASGSFAVARTVCDTKSAPNWGAHLTGAGPEFHGYTSNDPKPGIPPVTLSKYGRFPGIFGLARDAFPNAELAAIYTWERISQLVETQALSYDKHVGETPPNKDDPVQRVAQYQADDARALAAATACIIERKPLLTFAYFGSVDIAGHKLGHNTPGYYDALEKMDANVGTLLAALKTAGIEKDTVILLVSDHGGHGKKHGGIYRPDVIETPWIITGPGIKRAHRIQTPVVHTDTAATLAHLLNLTPPQCWRGRPVLDALQ
jgi:predicted AlkP superfamily pyrophosphatase or phosphodiesterase